MTFLPVDVLIDQKTKQRHRIDSLNLLAYSSLLVLVLVTTWFFKRRANKSHLHETGLAIIYGLIMGAALRYFGVEVTIKSIELEDKLPRTAPADYVTILSHNLGDKNTSEAHVYAYEFRGEILQNAKLGSQISYASVDPEVFFNIILPPIVLNAGLSLKRRHFFRNIGAIFSYAFIGTTISVATVGSILFGLIQTVKHLFEDTYLADRFTFSNCLYFGAIISPTDPLAVLAIFQELGVDVNLFALVFGESILNDAVSIVLTHSIDHFSVNYGRNSILRIIWQCFAGFIQMFLASCSLGALFGIATALTTKFTKLTESPLLESSLVVLMSYCSFLTAEVLDFSGIVAILMCGITQAHYTINNLSFEARERLKTLFELLTFLCESFLFLAVGVCFWQRGQTWDLPFIGMAFFAVTLARVLSVYPLTALLNLGRRQKIPMNYQHLITWGGAARGVISYSLAARNTVGDARRIMLSTTSVIVIVSVILVGAAVCPLLKWLEIPFGASSTGKRRAQVSGSNKQLVLPDQSNQCLSQYESDDESQTTYHATNNPAWLVRPKRLQPSGGCSLCSHHLHHHQRHLHQSSNSSLMLVANETSASPRMVAGSAKARPLQHDHLCHNVRRRQRVCSSSAAATPVIEIEAVPVVSGAGEMDAHWTLTGTRKCVCCLLAARNLAAYNGQKFIAPVEQLSVTESNLQGQDNALYQQEEGSQQERAGDENSGTLDSVGERTIITGPIQGELTSTSQGADLYDTTNSPSVSSLAQITDGSRLNDAAYQNANLVRMWRNIDNYFIKPLLTNSQPNLMETMPASLRFIARFLTSDEQMIERQQS